MLAEEIFPRLVKEGETTGEDGNIGENLGPQDISTKPYSSTTDKQNQILESEDPVKHMYFN